MNTYKAEAREKWGSTDAYRQYAEKTGRYRKEQWNDLAGEMDGIMAAFALSMKKGETPDSAEAQSLVDTLQSHISESCYSCTDEILSGLGRLYAKDERFKSNIDRHAEGTAAFICAAIEVKCRK